MYWMPYFDDNGKLCESEKQPDLESFARYIINNPHIDGPIFYKHINVGYGPEDVVLNGKLRRKFVNFMTKHLSKYGDIIDAEYAEY